MDARITRAALLTAVLLVSMGARHRSANFIVETADPRLAVQFAEAAEKYRHDLAVEWLGQPMPDWSQPCPMTVMVGPNLGAGGATTFVFDRGEVFGWRMTIQGSAERIADSVLPHEITHMIYASHFRQPLPRWADEGGATSVEHISERAKQRQMLDQFLRTGRGISFSRMFAMTDYPADIMPLYSQGYSLAEYLIQIGGRRKYVEFLDDGLKKGDWAGAAARNYGIANLGQLQNTWLSWVKQGMPTLGPREAQPGTTSPEMLAAKARSARPAPNSSSQQRNPDRLASTAIIPVGRLVPVPSSLLNPQTANSHPRSVPNNAISAVLPSSEWRTTGTRPSSPAMLAQSSSKQGEAPGGQISPALTSPSSVVPQADPFQAAVTRPQDAEQPRQVILEWSR